MGERGPAPKRSDQRRRTNSPGAGKTVKAPAAERVEVPETDPDWHPVARRWFESLAASGQHVFYEPSDWAAAYVLAESMSRELQPKPIITMVGPVRDAEGELVLVNEPPKAASVAAWRAGMAALMVTEADRRRASLELVRPRPADEEEGGDVPHLDDARRRLRGAG